jgi:thiosulfate/3-mercaptopyruvate sulfurtransferase
MWATRLWWMLRACGFDDAAVLDGGLPKWRAESRTVEKGSCCYPAAGIGFAPRPEMWADRAAVLAATEDARVCIINALPAESHAGVGAPQYGRPGHIKSSLSVPYQRLLTNEGQFRPDSELRELFDDIGAFSASKVICYCGGGIAATAEALALVRLGHPSVAVYDGSLVEWSQDPTLPMGIDVGSADAHA